MCAQNVSKSFQTCGVVQNVESSHDMILSLFVAGAVRTLCGLGGVEVL